MQNLPGHSRDAEAFFVVAKPYPAATGFLAHFPPGEPMEMSRFFARYAEIADLCEDAISAYEVARGR